MTKVKSSQKPPEFGPITLVASGLFGLLRRVSPMQWLSHRYPVFKSRADLTDAQIGDRDFVRRRARAVEWYLVACLAVEMVLAVLSTAGPWLWWFAVGLALIASVRVIEIVQVTVNATLFDTLGGPSHELVASPIRMIVLAGVNYLELLACFGVVYALNYTHLHGAGRRITAFYFSVITQLTIGYGDVYPAGWLRVVAATQGLVAILFIVLVFSRVVTSARVLRSASEEDRDATA